MLKIGVKVFWSSKKRMMIPSSELELHSLLCYVVSVKGTKVDVYYCSEIQTEEIIYAIWCQTGLADVILVFTTYLPTRSAFRVTLSCNDILFLHIRVSHLMSLTGRKFW